MFQPGWLPSNGVCAVLKPEAANRQLGGSCAADVRIDSANPRHTSLCFHFFLGVIIVRLIVVGILLVLLVQAVEFRKHVI